MAKVKPSHLQVSVNRQAGALCVQPNLISLNFNNNNTVLFWHLGSNDCSLASAMPVVFVS